MGEGAELWHRKFYKGVDQGSLSAGQGRAGQGRAGCPCAQLLHLPGDLCVWVS